MNRRNFLQAAGVGSTALALTVPAAAGDKNPEGVPDGRVLFEFLGRSNQDGQNVTHFGYLTHLLGLSDDHLFTDANVQTEATARFTFLATSAQDARHEHGNIITTSAPGELALFLNQTPQGDFDDPASFGHGQAIATFATRYYSVLNVQAPNQGITTVTVELTQLRASQFALAGQRLRLGRPGLRARLSATGQGARTQPNPVRAFYLVGGSAILE
jgi:hypothetical protein